MKYTTILAAVLGLNAKSVTSAAMPHRDVIAVRAAAPDIPEGVDGSGCTILDGANTCDDGGIDTSGGDELPGGKRCDNALCRNEVCTRNSVLAPSSNIRMRTNRF